MRPFLPNLVRCCLLLLVVTGCRASLFHSSPDLGLLYTREASSEGPERNPVIVIPGLTGSRLVDPASGRLIWGAFSGDYAKPDNAEDVRLLALPMAESMPLRDLQDGMVPDGVLDRVRIRLLGVPVDLRAYFQILSALGVGGYRDESIELTDKVDWGESHFTCFQFDYDWRRDNVENAKRLHQFIEQKRAYVRAEIKQRYGVDREDIKFDVVAHSMGGLLLRYYLRYGATDLSEDGSLPEVTWAGAANVDRAILVATPNAGTLESLEQLTQGRDYGPFLPKYSATILGTFPSGYQMLPRGRHRMLTVDGENVPDVFDPALWQRMQWGLAAPEAETELQWLLPEVEDPAARRRIALDHQRKNLARAKQFAAALDRQAEPPRSVEYYLIAGDSIPTPRRADARSQSGKIEVVETAPGDSKVLRSSALLDERLDGHWQSGLRTPIPWRNAMFLSKGHLGLTKDPVFTDNLLFWLLQQPRDVGR